MVQRNICPAYSTRSFATTLCAQTPEFEFVFEFVFFGVKQSLSFLLASPLLPRVLASAFGRARLAMTGKRQRKWCIANHTQAHCGYSPNFGIV
jgi:hypothetical protein